MGAKNSTENVQDPPQPFRNPNMALEINEKEESKTNEIANVKKSFTVVLFGETGHGKSYFGNELLNYGRNSTRVVHFTEGASINSKYSQFSCTSSSIKKDSPNFFGKKLSVIDTVGFYDNRGISGSDVLRQIMSCLQSMPDGFDLAIFCYSAHHPKFNDSSFEILRRWKKILGQNVFKNTIILLTQCNTLSPEKIKALNPQKKGLQKLLLEQFEQHEFQFFCAGLKDTQGNDPIYQQLAEKMNQITPYKPTLASFDWKNPKDYEKFLAVPEWRNMIEQIISDQEKVLTNFKEKALNPLKEDKIQLIRKGLKDLTNFLEGGNEDHQ